MTIAPIPDNEDARLKDLYYYELLDTAGESDFDDLVELASQICNCPISLITLIDRDRQWFKSKTGLEETGTSRDIAFCSHTILQDEVFVIEDATKDNRFFNNPLVTGEQHLRFYAGVPIVSPTGYKLGTLCMLDRQPKKLFPAEKRALLLLSKQVSKLLDIQRKNIELRKRAEEVLILKSRAIKKVMQETEREKKAIATNLHEGFAQQIASSILYLSMAAEDKTNHLIHAQVAKTQLHEVLVSMRKLSAEITPLAAEWLSANELIEEFIEKTAITYPFTIQVAPSRKGKTIESAITITAIRTLEKWFKLLSGKKEVTRLAIAISVDENLTVTVKDNGNIFCGEEREKELLDSGIPDRVQAYGGKVHCAVLDSVENVFSLVLPGEITAVTGNNAEHAEGLFNLYLQNKAS